METIYKKISIEPFKKRIVKKHTNNNAAKVEYYPSFEQGNNRIAYDIVVKDDTVSPFLILDIKNENKRTKKEIVHDPIRICRSDKPVSELYRNDGNRPKRAER